MVKDLLQNQLKRVLEFKEEALQKGEILIKQGDRRLREHEFSSELYARGIEVAQKAKKNFDQLKREWL